LKNKPLRIWLFILKNKPLRIWLFILINKPLRLTVMDYEARSKGEMIGDVVQAKVESGIIHEKD
jgi:hypothetical protein